MTKKRFFSDPNGQGPSQGIFRTLHLRLTALCASVTGLIIIILTIICLLISESGMRKQEYASFLSNLNTLYQNLEMQSSLSHQWIRQTEYNYQIILRIMDGGQPLYFQRFADKTAAAQEASRTAATASSDELLSLIEATATNQYGINVRSSSAPGTLTRHAEFPVPYGGRTLAYASAALIPGSSSVIGILAVHPLDEINTRILRQRISFFLTDLAALLLLLIFFWHFTAKMIQPLWENRQKQMQFIAAASHELRSPLTVILSNTAAVRNGIMPNDDQFLSTLDSEGHRMSRLVSDMLQLANADNHSWSIQPSEIELDTLLLQTWEDYEPAAASSCLRWEITLPDEEIPSCTCDAERIRQLLSILIDNAFSCTPADGCVRLSLAALPSGFRIAVSDNGPGIPDGQKAAIFERFYRADPSRNSKAHFGLGLSIAQEITKLHRAKLTVEDTPGGGATFVLVLPG